MKLMRCAMFALMASVLFFSCKKDDSLTPEEEKKDIYIGGYLNPTVNTYGAYFNNGSIVPVPSITYVWSMAVQGNDVYILDNLGYLKNGIQVNLPNVLSTSAIAVINGDNYVVGKAEGLIAAYWKNGILHPLSVANDTTYPVATDIAVSGNDIYISGYNTVDGGNVVYWKNDEIHTVGKGMSTGIAVSGQDVYIIGVSENSVGGVYWKNGVQKIPSYPDGVGLPFNGVYALTSIYIDGSDVYLTGGVAGSHAVYWKNDQPVYLSGSESTRGILVKGKDVFVIGNFIPIGGTPLFPRGVMWKNGVKDTIFENGMTTCITIRN